MRDARAVTNFLECLRDLKNPHKLSWSLIISAFDRFKIMVYFIYNIESLIVILPKSNVGAKIHDILNARCRGIRCRYAATVLTLPANADDFLKGKRKQALRTNIARAKHLGYLAKEVTGDEFAKEAVRLRDRIKSGVKLADEPCGAGMLHWIAINPQGQTVALARLLAEEQIAVLKFLGAIQHIDSGCVRYLLSTTVFMALAQRGIRHIIVGSVFALDDGLVFFQQRLGFGVFRIKVRQKTAVKNAYPLVGKRYLANAGLDIRKVRSRHRGPL